MKSKLLVDTATLKVGKAKYLGEFCDSGLWPIDDDEIIIVMPDQHIVTDRYGEDEYYYKVVPAITKQITSSEEMMSFACEYCSGWDNVVEDSVIYYKYRESANGPLKICREEQELIDAFEYHDPRCKFVVTPYRIVFQGDSAWDN